LQLRLRIVDGHTRKLIESSYVRRDRAGREIAVDGDFTLFDQQFRTRPCFHGIPVAFQATPLPRQEMMQCNYYHFTPKKLSCFLPEVVLSSAFSR